jgi:hypothetical protein
MLLLINKGADAIYCVPTLKSELDLLLVRVLAFVRIFLCAR